MANFILSAFADEADSCLAGQIKALKANNITHIEPRGLDLGNISTYTAEQCRELKKVLDDNGIAVSSIGSPYGKIKIRDDFTEHFDSFKRCVENAAILGTERIRMFSFFKEEHEAWKLLRDEVFYRLEKMADYSLSGGIWCCHENEKGIYGDTEARCYDILFHFEGKIKGVFDPANFIQCGVDVINAYKLLEQYIDYFHIKDGFYKDGSIVPVGHGDGKVAQLLKMFDQKQGDRFLTLEPHLRVFDGLKDLEEEGGTADKLKEDFTYPTNEAAFNAAADALHALLRSIDK